MDERRAEHNAGEPEPDVPEHHQPEHHEQQQYEQQRYEQQHYEQQHYEQQHYEAAASEPSHDAAMHEASDRMAQRTPARRGSGATWGLLLALVLVIAGPATSPWWAPPLAPLLPWAAPAGVAGVTDQSAREQIGAIASRLGQLEQHAAAPAALPPAALDKTALDKTNEQLAAFDRRLGTVEQQLAQLGQGGTAGSDLTALQQSLQRAGTALAQLADRVAALESKTPSVDPASVQNLQSTVAKLGTDVAALTDRIDKFAAAPDDSRTDQALVLALGQLRQAMAGSAPFGDALSAANRLAQSRSEVKTALGALSDAAARGVPSLAILRERFERIAGEIANANETPSSDWGPWLTDRLRAIFAARRVGAGAVGSGPEAAVATAEGALQAGDLAGAVAALGTLRGAAAATARPFLDEARRRLDAEAALDKAGDLVAARLAQAPAAPGAPDTAPEKQN
jgi:hypothetical protein